MTITTDKAALARSQAEVVEFDMLAHLQRQRVWSERTFGPGPRTQGVVDHIRKELLEILADPSDISEWIDVVILALDGAWRAGAQPQEIIASIVAKQRKNEGRNWPDWRTADPNKAIEHNRSQEADNRIICHLCDGKGYKPSQTGLVYCEACKRTGYRASAAPQTATRESSMVVVARDEAGTPTVWCDPEIADLVAALNAGGIPTVASCSGHGVNVGNIALRDGRELLIAPNFQTAREIESKIRTSDHVERCESGAPECGPVEFYDSEGVPLCRICYEGLAADAAPGSTEGGK